MLRKLVQVTTMVIFSISLAACGGATDAPDAIPDPIDADLSPDGTPNPIDADTTARNGTISINEIRLNGTSGATTVQGIKVTVSFSETPLPALGDGGAGTCTTWSFNAANPPPTGLNEGSVDFAVSGGSSVPTCIFTGPGGYLCLGAGGTAGDLAAGAPSTFTDANATFTAADVGNYISITGSASNNDGAFGVVGFGGATTVAIAHLAPTTEANANLNWTLIGGAGPIPGNQDPGLIADADTVDITFTQGGGNHFPSFTSTLQFGNDFDLDATSAGLLSNIPIGVTPAEMILSCAASPSCDPEAGVTFSGSVLLMEATNGDTTGLPGTSLPPGTAALVTRCSRLGGGAITVPVEHMQFYSDFFNGGGGTRIQSTFLTTVFAPEGTLNVIAGHGVVGFTDAP